jgi:hypothetical protein
MVLSSSSVSSSATAAAVWKMLFAMLFSTALGVWMGPLPVFWMTVSK